MVKGPKVLALTPAHDERGEVSLEGHREEECFRGGGDGEHPSAWRRRRREESSSLGTKEVIGEAVAVALRIKMNQRVKQAVYVRKPHALLIPELAVEGRRGVVAVNMRRCS